MNRTVTKVVLKLNTAPCRFCGQMDRTVTKVVLKPLKKGTTAEWTENRTVTKVVLKHDTLQVIQFNVK